MSQENVEVVLRAISTFETDADAWLETLHPDIEWIPFEEGTPSYGHEDALRLRQRWLESWGEHHLDVDEVLESGEHVFVATRIRGTGKLSGVAVELHNHMTFRVCDGKIVYILELEDRAEALKAAGLAE